MSDEAVEINVDASGEAPEEAVAEAATEVAESIADAVEAVAEAFTTEDQHGANVDLIVGGLVATVSALTDRVEGLESNVETASHTAEAALDTAIDTIIAIEEAATEPVPEPEVVEVKEDEAPPTRRSRFGDWFFGKSNA